MQYWMQASEAGAPSTPLMRCPEFEQRLLRPVSDGAGRGDDNRDEVLYVLEGRGRATIGGEAFELSPGAGAFVPRVADLRSPGQGTMAYCTQQAGMYKFQVKTEGKGHFVVALFAHVVPEDLMRYDPRQLAELAADAWAMLAVRKQGVPKIRFDAPDLAGHERLRVDSVLEIVNDDMPFLVDSVLAELAERGIDIHLVVHPVLSVVRDGAGRLTAFKGTKSAPGALRESVIYVHVERIDEQARRAEIVEAIERVIADVRVCVADWRAMVGRVAEEVAELTANPPPLPIDEVARFGLKISSWRLEG